MGISVIIPTILSCQNILKKSLSILEHCNFVDEIILINNSTKNINWKISKLHIIHQKKNLYVNPSWNLGITLIKNDYFMLLNDDILLNETFLKQLEQLLSTGYKGLMGLDKNSIIDNPKFATNLPLSLSELHGKRDFIYWGSCIIGRKEDYYKIPNDLKIFYGDDYLIEENQKYKKQVFKIENANLLHMHSSTSGLKKFKKTKNKDNFIFDLKYSKKNFIEKIFRKISIIFKII